MNDKFMFIDRRLYLKLACIKAFLLLIGMMVVNALANILPLNNMPTGVISDNIPNLFVPVGLTFSIWGLIYLLLLGYIIAVFMTVFSKEEKDGWDIPEAFAFILNICFNAAWIFAWHWLQFNLSLLIMFGILLTLIILMERNHKIFSHAQRANTFSEKARRFFLRVPILVYLGWICVATIANITAVLVSAGWGGFGISEMLWTILVIYAGTLVAILLLLRRSAVAAALVFLWAYFGIILKRLDVGGEVAMPIIIATAIAMGLIGLVLLKVLFIKKE